MRTGYAASLALCCAWPGAAEAQRTQENSTRQAEDAFGSTVGNESIGIYASGEVRGFSASAAGNNRVEEVYFDRVGAITDVVVRGSNVRLGLTAFGYPLPAPTGIVDVQLRRAGNAPAGTVQLTSGEYAGPDLIADVSAPIGDQLGVFAAIGLFDDEYVSGANAWFVSYGTVLRWKPVDGTELTGFYARYDYGDEEREPVIFTGGAFLPPAIERRRFFGQTWADWAGHSQNYGVILKTSLGPWQIAAGGFNSRFTRDDYAAPYIDRVDARGGGRSFVVLGEDQRAASTSGEVRVARVFAEGNRRHRLLASVRGRDVQTDYGGFALADLGDARIGVPAPVARPALAYPRLTRDRVRQRGYALGYDLVWQGTGELNLGVTRSAYAKRIAAPGLPETVETDRPWLWNAALAVTPTERLTVYAAATRGLEESGVAPSNAANRGDALPALRTRQHEVGLRYALGGGWRLVSAAFDIAKPFLEIDRADGVFKPLGTVTHRGVEASLSGRPVKGMSLVAGAVLLRPRVRGQAVDDGRVGEKPIGRTGLLIDAAVDYQLPRVSGLSIDTRIVHEGARTANATATLDLPARTVIDVGARYRTRIGSVPVLLRAQLRNVADVFGWRVSSGGGFTLLPGRRALLSVTADL